MDKQAINILGEERLATNLTDEPQQCNSMLAAIRTAHRIVRGNTGPAVENLRHKWCNNTPRFPVKIILPGSTSYNPVEAIGILLRTSFPLQRGYLGTLSLDPLTTASYGKMPLTSRVLAKSAL